MRVTAILAVYNEERFIGNCLEHLRGHGIDVYLIDNGSTDATVAIAERYVNRGLVAIERFPRDGVYRWQPLLERKEELAATLPGDWFMNVDADEVHVPPRPGQTLANAFAEVEAEGYNAVNFQEFTFCPTREEPDHDHPNYLHTMRWYYPFRTHAACLVRAWKRPAEGRAEFAWDAGHRLRFPGLRLYPKPFRMRHYMFLSPAHAHEKYGRKNFAPEELERGWHGWRSRVQGDSIRLPGQAELKTYISDDQLDPSKPRIEHVLAQPKQEKIDGKGEHG
jgi:glycosyltransferase involved in cell wall biosynthesis